MAERHHPEDIEREGRSLVAVAGPRAGRRVATARWRELREEGRHPSVAEIVGYLRGYSAPLGDWLPEGMAEYLAARLAGEHPRPRGGRRPRRRHDLFLDRTDGTRLARAVLLRWAHHRKAGTPSPQDTACEDVAQDMGRHVVEVRVALTEHREGAAHSLRVALLNGRYPLSEEDAALARLAVAWEEERQGPTDTPTDGA